MTSTSPDDSAATPTWRPELQIAYPHILEVALSPDGQHVVYVVQEPLLTEEKSEFISHLYLAAGDGAEPIQLTFGESRNSGAQWSPDGAFLAFLSTRSGKTNLYVLRVRGGEAWAVTRYEKSDIAAVRWAPDGTRLAFLMSEPPTEEKEKARKAKDDALQVDVDLEFAHLYTVPFAVGPRTVPEAMQLTHGRYHVGSVAWLPDSSHLAFTSQPSPVADVWPQTRLALIAADGTATEPTELARVGAWAAVPLPSPDGHWIACFTSDQPISWAFAGRMTLYPVAGGPPQPLADTPDGNCAPISWSAEGDAVYVLEASGVTTQVWALPVTGEAARPVTATPLVKTATSANRQGMIAFVGEDFHVSQAVYVLDPTTGTARRVAQPALPADWPATALPTAEAVNWRSPDGRAVEGILVYPLGYQAGQRYPLIVDVHGGPAGVFTRLDLRNCWTGYMTDILTLAEHGYALLRPNPRGSSGYGREFRFANQNDWGQGDYQDIMAGVDHVIARGIADPDRLGVAGYSYGGYMTSAIITQTARFKAACVGGGVTNLVSFTGTADIPSFIPDYFSGEFWEDLETYRQHSPLLNVRGVSTPTLILHGDADVRVPVGQGRELYNALRRQRVPVEMVIYPRQGHGFSEPRLLLDFRRRMVAWFDRWLGDTATAEQPRAIPPGPAGTP